MFSVLAVLFLVCTEIYMNIKIFSSATDGIYVVLLGKVTINRRAQFKDRIKG
jgi:uncharacterized membrane protein YagU involved in acid resistance